VGEGSSHVVAEGRRRVTQAEAVDLIARASMVKELYVEHESNAGGSGSRGLDGSGAFVLCNTV
jgi:hypothetical protein